MTPPVDLPNDQIRAQQRVLVDKLLADGHLQTTAVSNAFLAIPRHLFLPDVDLGMVYSDRVIPTKFEDGEAISSSSQPAIMAIMLEQLGLEPGHRVLEIGAGTGYNAALMGHIVGSSGQVTTIDLDEDIVAAAQAHLRAAGVDNATAVCADGIHGYPANAPYDRIILTVGHWDITPDWWAQLAPNGRLLLPLSLNGPQVAVAFDRDGDAMHSVSLSSCGFMRLRGEQAEPLLRQTVQPHSGIWLTRLAQAATPEITAVWHWLQQPPFRYPIKPIAPPPLLWRRFRLWLALHTNQTVLFEMRSQPDSDLPGLLAFEQGDRWQFSLGLLWYNGLALLAATDAGLQLMGFGPAQTAVVQQLATYLTAWEAVGMPGEQQLWLTAIPSPIPPPSDGGVILPRPGTTFIAQWGTNHDTAV